MALKVECTTKVVLQEKLFTLELLNLWLILKWVGLTSYNY